MPIRHERPACYRPGDRVWIADRAATVADPAYTAAGSLRVEIDGTIHPITVEQQNVDPMREPRRGGKEVGTR